MKAFMFTLNAVAVAGLLGYGIAIRSAQATTDQAVLYSMMDNDVSTPALLMPPEVK